MLRFENRVKLLQFYFSLVALFGGFSLFFYEKGTFELFINSFHHPLADEFFKRITHLGDGLVLVFFILLSILFSYRNALLIAVGSIIHILLVHFCKKWLFKGFPRPVEYLKEVTFYQIPGETMNHWQSFPSGHTTTAFMLATALILCVPRKRGLHLILISLACLVGFSRIYLMQHFWIDVWAGALLGIASTLMGYYLLRNYLDQKKFQKGLLKKEVLPNKLQEFFSIDSRRFNRAGG